jgi:hypothetical protein
MATPTMPTTQADSALPQYFTPPPRNPVNALFNAVSWTDQVGDAPPRWSIAGVALRSSVSGNIGAEDSAGIWNAPWCGDPGSGDVQIKEGTRGADPEPFEPVVAWSYDTCDLTAESRSETKTRAQQTLRMREGLLIARAFGDRLVADLAEPVVAVDDLTDALGELEALLAAQNILGMVFCSPYLLCHMVSHVLIVRSGLGWTTPGGHAVIFDSGLADSFGDSMLIATTAPLFGWRGAVSVTETLVPEENRSIVIAERSTLIAYEAMVGAVEITASST